MRSTQRGIGVRRVTGRNAPSVINSVYNVRNFWDGRANNIFNGMNPFGLRDQTLGLLVVKNRKLQPMQAFLEKRKPRWSGR